MAHEPGVLADVFTLEELAQAAGVSPAEVQGWAELGAIRTLPTGDGLTWVAAEEACRVGAALRDGTFARTAPSVGAAARGIVTARRADRARLRLPLAASTGIHAGLAAGVLILATMGVGGAAATATTSTLADETRLVFLALPGPGGGGGGGGTRDPLPPPRAERRGTERLDSPVPARSETPLPMPVELPEPSTPEPLPEVQAPVVLSAANDVDVDGELDGAGTDVSSRGPGSDSGVGSGEGEGVGEGDGSGIGDGSGGGTGGGPYRPGSGITPPALLREVKPDYSDEARRRGITGEVLMEIVVERDGTVGDVRVLRGLGFGLDERAVAAVRQWRFAPATRGSQPVDVLVEVAMEFTLR